MFPTDARLLNRDREVLVRLAQRHVVKLHRSHLRVGEFTLVEHQRCGTIGNRGPTVEG
jgi:transposase, IS5 family